MATLHVTAGPSAGRSFDLERHALVMIGRDPDCTFQLLDARVSRRHFQIRLDPETQRHHLVECGSRNGIDLNGERVPDGGDVPLRGGDVIGAGGSKLVYRADAHPSAENILTRLRRFGEHRRTTLVGLGDDA